MTKEELKREAEKLYEDWYAHKLGAISIIDVICKMAEPREKRIAELEEANKANEWHFVKDGDLPKKTKEYLVYKIDGYGCKSIQVMQFNNQHCWCANCQNEIKAWKEIILPEEIKEND